MPNRYGALSPLQATLQNLMLLPTPPVRVKHVAPRELTTDHVIVDIYGVQHAIERISYYDSVSGHSCVGAISANGWAETYRVDRDVATVVDDQPPPTDEPRRREACELALAF